MSRTIRIESSIRIHGRHFAAGDVAVVDEDVWRALTLRRLRRGKPVAVDVPPTAEAEHVEQPEPAIKRVRRSRAKPKARSRPER